MSNSLVDSSLKNKEEKSINVLDIIKYLLFHWKWYILALLVSVGYSYYQYSKTPFIYKQATTIIIKTPANSQTTMRMNRFNSFSNPVNVSSEILQFRSKDLIRRVIDRSQANISYSYRKGLRDNELYSQSPIQVTFFNNRTEQYSFFDVKLLNNNQVELTVNSESSITVRLGAIVNTAFGKIIITPSDTYAPNWFGKTIKVTKYPRENLVGYFLGNLTITQTDETAAVIQLQMEDASPVRAAKVLNTLVELYNEEAKQDKNSIADTTERFIKKRLSIIEHGLDSVESNLEKLQTFNGGFDIGTAADMYLSDGREYQTQGKELTTQSRLANYMKQYLLDSSRKNELLPSNTGLVDANIEGQISQYNNLLLKRNHLFEASSENNPVVEDLDKVLYSIKRNIINSMNNILMGLSIRKNDITKEADVLLSQAMRIPAKKREILSIERQQKVKQDLYIFLLNKREENALNKAMTEDNAKVIDPASGSFSPIYPNKYKKVMIGAACGLAFPTVILLLVFMLDTAVRTRKEIEDATSVPFLAEIPLLQRKEDDNSDMLVKLRGHDSFAESFRILRTNLGFMATENTQKTITFTSFNVGAGKTFTALNMAISLTQINKKIILLDLDLRKGMLSTRLNIKKGKGVTHYLSDQLVPLDEIIVKNIPTQNIDLIPIGAIAPNPVELLLNKRLDLLIEELKKQYDYIIVDNVPLGIVADSSIINRITDITIFVARSGKLDRRQLPEIERFYQDRKLNNMAILLNGIQKNAFSYGYGYGYENPKNPRWKFWKKYL